jgi:hypothetical protein
MRARWYQAETGQFTSVDPALALTDQAYDYAGDNPVNEADPSGDLFMPTGPEGGVNLQGVAQWARKNAPKKDNNGFSGEDCTDFVSRALLLGGEDHESVPPGLISLLDSGSIFDVPLEDNDALNDHYWYNFAYGMSDGNPLTAHSNSWSAALDLAEHLKLNGSRWLVNGMDLRWASCVTAGLYYGLYGLPSDVQPGDVIFANWSSGSFSGISHAGVIVGSQGQLEIAQHSFDRIDSFAAWEMGGSDTHVWIVDPNEG